MTFRTLQTSVSGLSAEARAIGVVSDNIANVNTPGYRRQREWFEDALTRNSGGGGFGAGVRLSNIKSVFSQGHLSQTGIATDLAINGEGFFAVGGTVSGMTGTFFTRAGQFRLAADGGVVNTNGLALLGRPALPDGRLAAEVVPLTVPVVALPAQPTKAISFAANLDASAPTSTAPFDPNNAATTAQSSTGIPVFDSLGNNHALEVYFRKTGDGQWEYHALADGDELNPVQPGVKVEVGSGEFTFTSDGELATFSQTQPVSVSWGGGAAGAQPISLSAGTAIADGGSGLDGATQFSAPSSVSQVSQDGYSSGAASGVNVQSNGMVDVQYTNGMSRSLGMVVLAQFRSPNGLSRAGEGLFAQTRESGQAVLGGPGSGGRGNVTAGAVEGSNVDLAEEMVGMIRHQRAFGANSKVISTADDMLAAFMSIKS